MFNWWGYWKESCSKNLTIINETLKVINNEQSQYQRDQINCRERCQSHLRVWGSQGQHSFTSRIGKCEVNISKIKQYGACETTILYDEQKVKSALIRWQNGQDLILLSSLKR